MIVYHIFADEGAESEVLSAIDGVDRVVRVGLDPSDKNRSEPVRADAGALPLKRGADLAVLQPPCQRFSSSTMGTGDPMDHPDLIDLARGIGEEYADHYIIENVPRAPLRDPVVLGGKHFGLNIVYRRAFETSFPVPQIEENQDLIPSEGPMGDQGTTSKQWVGPKSSWRCGKQYLGDYSARHLKRNCVPAPVMWFLVSHWLRALDRGERDVPERADRSLEEFT